jgi:hypothetical protein
MPSRSKIDREKACANMPRVCLLSLAILGFTAALASVPLHAQNDKSGEPGKGEPGKDASRRGVEIAEAGGATSGAAARAECIWLGERAVGLMWRDDLDTALRHLDLYDRLGCPGEHVQISFRCVVRQGRIDQKDQKTLDASNARVHLCWINPALPPSSAQAAVEKSGTK